MLTHRRVNAQLSNEIKKKVIKWLSKLNLNIFYLLLTCEVKINLSIFEIEKSCDLTFFSNFGKKHLQTTVKFQ